MEYDVHFDRYFDENGSDQDDTADADTAWEDNVERFNEDPAGLPLES